MLSFVSSFQGASRLEWQDLMFRGRSINIRLVMMAEGNHAYPSRTRTLSLPASMVLGPQGPGRVERRQANPPCVDE